MSEANLEGAGEPPAQDAARGARQEAAEPREAGPREADGAPPVLFDTGLRHVLPRYAQIAASMAAAFTPFALLGLGVVGGDAVRQHGLGQQHLMVMLPVVLGATALVLGCSAAGALFMWGWDRWQLRRTLRRLSLGPGERVLAVVPAYVSPTMPVLSRMQTFGEFLVLTDARLLHLRYGFMGFRSAQRVLAASVEVVRVTGRDLRLGRSPLIVWLLELSGLQRSLLWRFATKPPVEFVPEHPNFEPLVAWLRAQGYPVEAGSEPLGA
ncbi:MAG: hypothetical protein AB7N76_19305 [Planctomycetota bacterium]